MADKSGGRFRDRKVEGRADSISCLPDVILQHILSFIPTKFAVRTSLLSKRWKHVWSETPSLSFNTDCHPLKLKAACVNKTLTHYTAPKVMNFDLCTSMINDGYRWVEFVMSRRVEIMSLNFRSNRSYKIPDFFFINSSVKQLTVDLNFADMTPRCSVSWTSLRKLSLRCCNLFDESMANILSGCPILESLTLYFCDELRVLDLSKSTSLRRLEIDPNIWIPGPAQIVAPHIHYLRLKNSQLPCTFVDVSSLTEAKVDIFFNRAERKLKAHNLRDMVLKMVEKLQHVEKLTFGASFLQILSLAELLGVPFPMFKVKALKLETPIFQYVIPGIERLLQNSPDLKKLTLHTNHYDTIEGRHLDKYLVSKNLNPDQCWISKDGICWNKSHGDVESKHLVSLAELVLKNTEIREDVPAVG